MSVVEVRDLRFEIRRHFWSARRGILRGVTFTVGDGEIFGFLGPNGAGKTTTIKALLGLITPSSGEVRLMGRPGADAAVRRALGFMPERAYFPEHLSGTELVMQHALLAGLPLSRARRRRDEVLEQVGLAHAASDRLGGYSKGMLQRVSLAQALVGEPKLVILDEPLSGLDPIGRRDFRDIMLHLKDAGCTVFFSTHILPDVEMICHRVAIMVAGRVRKVGTLRELTGDSVAGVEISADRIPAEAIAAAQDLSRDFQRHDHGATFTVSGDAPAGALIDLLRGAGATIRRVHTLRGSLEDVFVDEATGAARKGAESCAKP